MTHASSFFSMTKIKLFSFMFASTLYIFGVWHPALFEISRSGLQTWELPVLTTLIEYPAVTGKFSFCLTKNLALGRPG